MRAEEVEASRPSGPSAHVHNFDANGICLKGGCGPSAPKVEPRKSIAQTVRDAYNNYFTEYPGWEDEPGAMEELRDTVESLLETVNLGLDPEFTASVAKAIEGITPRPTQAKDTASAPKCTCNPKPFGGVHWSDCPAAPSVAGTQPEPIRCSQCKSPVCECIAVKLLAQGTPPGEEKFREYRQWMDKQIKWLANKWKERGDIECCEEMLYLLQLGPSDSELKAGAPDQPGREEKI